MATPPEVDSKLIVTKEPYTSLILSGEKTMELRCRRVKGQYFLADSTSHTVKAHVTFGESKELSQEDYEATRELHRVDAPTKRYKKTVGTLITEVELLTEPIPYKVKKGAIGFARFQHY
jgi:hypothetical protein